jgi:hypothetical protein
MRATNPGLSLCDPDLSPYGVLTGEPQAALLLPYCVH